MKKDELIALAKEISETEDLTNRGNDIAALKKEADRISRSDGDSMADIDYNKQFMAYYNEVAKRESSINEALVAEKKALIEKAKATLEEKNFKQANADLAAIFDSFKGLGRLSKEQDDALWTELKEVRATLNKNRDEYFAQVKADLQAKKTAKQDLIAKAKEAAAIENIKEATNQLNDLMEQWKKVGYAGKDNDDALWNEFNGIRKEFFERRANHYAEIRKANEEKAAKKEELIKEAKMLLARSEFTEEETNQVKALRTSWKEVGYAGKDVDDKLWNEFNETVNKYFEEKRSYSKNK